MHGDVNITRQSPEYKSRTFSSNSRFFSVVLLMLVVLSGVASIIYSSPLPFFITLTLLLLIPSVFFVSSSITPLMLLGAHVFSRLILDSISAITYKNIVGSLSIMKLYSGGVIAFGLLYLFRKKEMKLDWLLISFLFIFSTLLATTIYHQTWVGFVESVLKFIYLWLIIKLARLSTNESGIKRFTVVVLLCYSYSIANLFYSIMLGNMKCASDICRFIGTYSHQSDFSFIMLAIVPVSLYLMIIEKRNPIKFLYATTLLIAHIGIYSASYRTTWIMLAVYWAVFSWLFMQTIQVHKRILISIVAILIMAIGLVLVQSSSIGERLAPLVSLFQNSSKYLDMSSSEAYRTITGQPYVDISKENLLLSGRIGDWKALMIGYMDAPIEEKILGLGLGMDKQIMGKYKWGEAYDAHNIYIETLVETGILGLLVLLGVFVVIFYKLLFQFKKQLLPITIASPIFFSYMIAGLAGNVFDDIRLMLCLGLYLGVALYYQEPHAQKR